MSELKVESHFDENKASAEMDRYSRQIAALGADTMKNLASLSVLIIGLRGVGAETAKDLILTGPKAVTLYDNNITRIEDLGANFYLKEEQVGQMSRSAACTKSLAELNPFCDVRAYTGDLTDDFIQTFGVVVVTETLPRDQLIRINNLCRNRKGSNQQPLPAGFILAVTHGATGHIFTDFGPNHQVTDEDGEPSRSMVVDDFIVDKDGDGNFLSNRVKVMAKRHGFDDGDCVQFEDFEGEVDQKDDTISVTKLNGLQGVKVKRIYFSFQDGSGDVRQKQLFDQFEIDLSETEYKGKEIGGWKTGGIVNEKKKVKPINFRSFEDCLKIPATEGLGAFYGPQHPDQGEWEKGAGKTIHLCYETALTFFDLKGYWPRLHNEDDARLFMNIYKQLNAAQKNAADGGEQGMCYVDNFDEHRVRAYSWYFGVELTGYCAFLGGVAAQEVVKKFGKYTPIVQWLHCDHKQFFGNTIPSDAIPQGCRYDHQISIFGKQFQKLLSNQKIFLVGCGALGCEYLKGLALMGVATGSKGKVWCTDMDRIEVSNLSRQFLFRGQHVGKQKSTTAANSARDMNNAFNVEPLEMKVWPESENFFTDHFWDNLDLCWNALDNVIARKYTDFKCLLHGKPLLESGTQGTKCNSEVIIPYKTKSYNDGEETEAAGIPMCTLQNFPYLPVHCIEWARSSFAKFENIPQMYNSYLEDPNKFYEQLDNAGAKEQIEMLQAVIALCSAQQSGQVNFKSCLQLAFSEFYEQHMKRIKDLVYMFPENEEVKDKDTGEVLGKFWTGHKRFPVVPKFDVENEAFVNYMYCASNLWAFVFGLNYKRNLTEFKQELVAAGLQEPEWKPPVGLTIETDPNAEPNQEEEKDDAGGKEAQIEELKKQLEALNRSKCKKLNPHDFEKDDDNNFHIDYITAAANARARNYRIREQTRHECKITAGRIIAALATTTAMICGLVELEFYKLKLGLCYVHEDAFYNANINLGVSQFQFFQPDSANRHEEREEKDEAFNEIVKVKPFPRKWTSWDHVVVNHGNLTCREFGELFPRLFEGIKCKLLFGYKAKEGGLICDFDQREKSTANQDAQLNKENLSDRMRQEYQRQKDVILKKNKQIAEILDAKVIDRFLTNYTKNGKLVSDARNYVLLDGEFYFDDPDETKAELPIIQYFFK